MTTSPSTSRNPAPGGLDVAVLTRLANELFRESGTAAPSAHPAGVTSLEAPPAPGARPQPPASAPDHLDSDVRRHGAAGLGAAAAGESLSTIPANPPAAAAPTRPGPVSPTSALDATALQQLIPGNPGIPLEAELRRAASLPRAPQDGIYALLSAADPTPAYAFAGQAPASSGALPTRPPAAPAPAIPGDPWTAPVPLAHVGIPPFDVERVRRDFPILEERVNGRRLVWLDNAATTHKPRQVIDRLAHFYTHENSNIHRAAHTLAARATDAYEGAREKIRAFLNAGAVEEIVYARGATEAINLVANAWGRPNLKPGDEIVLTVLEHHANIVPWQQVAAATGAVIRVAPVDEHGQIILDDYARLLGPRTRLVSFTQVSNALGTVTPAKRMIELAHAAGALALLDGAQAVSHLPVDVRALGADFYVFSGHKVFGPTGIGALYGRRELLDAMAPWQGGGNMIADVTFEKTVYQAAPARFEAGTGNIADAVGLGAALDYVQAIGRERINDYEHRLLAYGTALLRGVPGLRPVGTAADKAGVLSFVIDGMPTAEVGKALDREGIAVRSGHHCAQPILRRFGLESSVRPSLALYNTCADLDALAAALLRLTAGRRML
jgi:cysteine desulfurase/selenocysteine lyase